MINSLPTYAILIVMAVILTIAIAILIVNISINLYIKRHSIRVNKVHQLNSETDFFNVGCESHSRYFERKPQYDNFTFLRFKDELAEMISNKYAKYCDILKQCTEDIEKYDDYMTKYIEILNIESNLNDKLLRKESKILQKQELPFPALLSVEYICEYTSPKGRNSYQKTYCIDYDDFVEIFNQVKELKQKQRRAKRIAEKNERTINDIVDGLNFQLVSKVENMWIVSQEKHLGLKYITDPGCYVFLIFDKVQTKKEIKECKYQDVYVGQSINVNSRVHNHINGKGNGDIYADIRSGKRVFVATILVPDTDLNDIEIGLIKYFNAEKSYNKTHGGAVKRREN